MSEIKLLPCPFCGGEAKFITGSPFIWEHAVACAECGSATRMIGGVTPSMARNRVAQVWNTRKPMQEIVERLDEIKKNFVVNASSDYLAIHYALAIDSTIKVVKEAGGMND